MTNVKALAQVRNFSRAVDRNGISTFYWWGETVFRPTTFVPGP